MNKYTYNPIKMTPFKWFVLENFPFIEEDFDALTSYQLWCKLKQYFENVSTKTNELGTEVEKLSNAFIVLKDYIDNYFENLDVQDEINYKLDEMVENGTLDNIVGRYITRILPRTYENVAEMKADTSLIAGMFAKTLGYYAKNDGGGAEYLILTDNSLIQDNGSVHNLDNGNKATIYTNNGKIKLEQFGIVGNTNDNSNCNDKLALIFNYAVQNNLIVECMKKVYTCFSVQIPDNLIIHGNGATFKKPNFTIDPYNESPTVYGRRSIFSIDRRNSNLNPSKYPVIIKDCTFDGNCWEIWSIEEGFSQQQASLITIFGNPNVVGNRVKAEFYNITLQNNSSDGFHMRDHADVYIENCESYDCFRGGLTCTGGGSILKVNGMNFHSIQLPDGIDFENDSGNTELNNYFLQNIIIDNDLDLAIPGVNSLIYIDGMTSKGSVIIRGTTPGITIKNSNFIISNPELDFRIGIANEDNTILNFENCSFEGALSYDDLGNLENGTSIHFSAVYQGDHLNKIKNIFNFNNCNFKKLKTISGGNCYNSEITFKNCNFEDTIVGEACIGELLDANTTFSAHIINLIENTFNTSNYCIHTRASSQTPHHILNIINNKILNPENKGFNLRKSIVNWEQIFIEYGYNINYTGDTSNRNFGKRLIITTDTTKIPTNSFPGIKGEDTLLIMDTNYVKVLAKFVYNVQTKSWDTIFNNIT